MITNLVLSGGGVKGICHCGAIKKLRELGVLSNVKNIAGTSAGSIVGLFFACNATDEFMYETFKEMDISQIRDSSWNTFYDLYYFWYYKGWYRGDALIKILGDQLEKITDRNITFKQIYEKFGKFLTVFATKVGFCNGEPTVDRLTLNMYTYPEMPVLQAIRMSAGVPYLFSSVRFENCDVVDGGILYNYPIDFFENEEDDMIGYGTKGKTLGLKLITDETFQECSDPIPCNVYNFSSIIFASLFDKLQQIHHSDEDWEKTIPIKTSGSSLNFKLTNADKEALYSEGIKSVEKYSEKIKF